MSERTVPVEYEGLWRRRGIWRSNGTSDLVTPVWWFQGASFHIDLRIPVDRNEQTGFAGVTVVEGERCEWRPEIAFPFLSPELDAGIMRFDSPDTLHETGIDGSYEEDWERAASGPTESHRAVDAHGKVSIDITCSDWHARAVGLPHKAAEITVMRRTASGVWKIVASTIAARENVIIASP
jgi:hypothetical protein